MKIVIFGLSISSSWGNGHATLWRGLVKGLARRGHHVVFYERDTDYYRTNRDIQNPEGCRLEIYPEWSEIVPKMRRDLADADAGVVTSYCADGIAAGQEVCESRCIRAFYDLDTPVTLQTWEREGSVPYIGSRGLRDFDIVFSYTGGEALSLLKKNLGARHVVPLYGSADPAFHAPVEADPVAGLSYLGTYAADRQDKVERLFVEAARRRPEASFLLGGAQYPSDFPWTGNILFWRHVAPAYHPMFYASSRLTLNVTRASMAALGYCPSGRLFEAASCGIPVISDTWLGLDEFFSPGTEYLPASTTEDVLNAIDLSPEQLKIIGRNARERTLAQHTAEHRAIEMEHALEGVASAGRGQTQLQETH